MRACQLDQYYLRGTGGRETGAKLFPPTVCGNCNAWTERGEESIKGSRVFINALWNSNNQHARYYFQTSVRADWPGICCLSACLMLTRATSLMRRRERFFERLMETISHQFLFPPSPANNIDRAGEHAYIFLVQFSGRLDHTNITYGGKGEVMLSWCEVVSINRSKNHSRRRIK